MHTLQRTRHLKCGSGDIDIACNVLGSQPTTNVFTLYMFKLQKLLYWNLFRCIFSWRKTQPVMYCNCPMKNFEFYRRTMIYCNRFKRNSIRTYCDASEAEFVERVGEVEDDLEGVVLVDLASFPALRLHNNGCAVYLRALCIKYIHYIAWILFCQIQNLLRPKY